MNRLVFHQFYSFRERYCKEMLYDDLLWQHARDNGESKSSTSNVLLCVKWTLFDYISIAIL